MIVVFTTTCSSWKRISIPFFLSFPSSILSNIICSPLFFAFQSLKMQVSSLKFHCCPVGWQKKTQLSKETVSESHFQRRRPSHPSLLQSTRSCCGLKNPLAITFFNNFISYLIIKFWWYLIMWYCMHSEFKITHSSSGSFLCHLPLICHLLPFPVS